MQEYVKRGLRVGNRISEIEEMAKSENETQQLAFKRSGEVVAYINSQLGPGQSVSQVYWVTGRANMVGIVDNVKTKLAMLSGELIRAVPDGQETPSPEQASQALNLTMGDNNQVNLNQGGARSANAAALLSASEEADDTPTWWKRWRRPGTVLLGAVTVVGVLAGLGQWLGWTLPF